jgi:hypothetical protein
MRLSQNVSISAREKVRDPLHWLQNHTKTKDPHWLESGFSSPHRASVDLKNCSPRNWSLLNQP